jgi:hypothetical protein
LTAALKITVSTPVLLKPFDKVSAFATVRV